MQGTITCTCGATTSPFELYQTVLLHTKFFPFAGYACGHAEGGTAYHLLWCAKVGIYGIVISRPAHSYLHTTQILKPSCTKSMMVVYLSKPWEMQES